MSSTCEKLSSNKVKLDFVVDAEKFEQGIQTAYKKLVKRINIPGFRRGKAPMKVIENYYGASVFTRTRSTRSSPKSMRKP